MEALYAALVLLGHEGVDHLLDQYRWKDEFLEANAGALQGGAPLGPGEGAGIGRGRALRCPPLHGPF